MRGKRSKQYRKLMQQYTLHFGFREPYQVLLDAAILEDAARFKMDFVTNLSKALHGQIKPMLTTCSIRHLSTRNDQHSTVMEHARAIERRRCNHHDLEDPLSELDCLTSVVDPKATKNNKHKLVVASQDERVRSYMRSVPGTPLVYLKRSVLVMEPMAESTEKVREIEERGKMRAGIRVSKSVGTPLAGKGLKRKRGESGEDPGHEGRAGAHRVGKVDIVGDVPGGLDDEAETRAQPEKRKRRKGPSGPNPLSVKKAKSKMQSLSNHSDVKPAPAVKAGSESTPKTKRKRRHKTGDGTEGLTADKDVLAVAAIASS